jgi:DNA-binding response OmpR family regulator
VQKQNWVRALRFISRFPQHKKFKPQIPMDILHIEDDEMDAHIVLHELNKNYTETNYFRVDEIIGLNEALKRKWDIILCDFDLREFDGSLVLSLIRDYGIDTPVIMVSGRVDDDIIALTKRLGAADYIMKDNLKDLAPAICRALKIGIE